MNERVSVARLFRESLLLKPTAYALTTGRLRTFILYFLMLNLIMFLPLTFSIYNMGGQASTLLGINARDNVDEQFIEALPEDCEILNQRLVCETDTVHQLTILNNETLINVFINVTDDETQFDQPNTLVLKETFFAFFTTTGNRFAQGYEAFEYLSFAELRTQSPEEAYDILFDNFYAAVRPFLILPMTLYLVGGLMFANVLLLLGLTGLAMLLRLANSDVPGYGRMLKLFILASTIPAMVNLGLGFAGLSAFSAIPYNFLTPLMAFLLYRKHKLAE